MTTSLFDRAHKGLKALVTRKVRIECDRMPFEFQRVPLRKILNWILVEASILVKPERPWGWPTHAQIEPTSACNLKCVLCPVTEGLERPQGHMELRTFKRIIDELGQHLFIIILWDWGEPFLNPSIYDMISYARTRDIGVVSSTNGHVFARGDHAEQLVHSGIDYIVFAVDGVTQATYERYRQGGDLETVTAGIKRIVEARHALQSRTPLIDLRFLVMKHNEHEIPQLEAFARSLEVDALTLRTLCTYDDGEYCVTEPDGRAFVPQNPNYQPFKLDPRSQSRIRRKVNPCKVLWNNPAIHHDGKVCPCTFDPHGRHVLGDLGESTFANVWWGADYRALRRQFRNDYQQLALCCDCTYAFEGGSMGEERDREVYFFRTPSARIAD
jgi:radical SAM protein with 4Fe4S-binding SPASM domain